KVQTVSVMIVSPPETTTLVFRQLPSSCVATGLGPPVPPPVPPPRNPAPPPSPPGGHAAVAAAAAITAISATRARPRLRRRASWPGSPRRCPALPSPRPVAFARGTPDPLVPTARPPRGPRTPPARSPR